MPNKAVLSHFSKNCEPGNCQQSNRQYQNLCDEGKIQFYERLSNKEYFTSHK